jgi:hypothetical protein
MIDPKLLPARVLELMDPITRKQLGRGGRTQSEIAAAAQFKDEKEFHEQTEAELRRRNLYFVTSRMDRKPTIREGAADYIVILPGERCVMLELKLVGGEFSDAQIENARDYHNQTGGVVHPCYTLLDVIRHLPPEA